MTSSNRNISRATGHLGGEFTDHRRIPLSKASDWGTLMFSLIWAWQNGSLWRHCNGIYDSLPRTGPIQDTCVYACNIKFPISVYVMICLHKRLYITLTSHTGKGFILLILCDGNASVTGHQLVLQKVLPCHDVIIECLVWLGVYWHFSIICEIATISDHRFIASIY